MSSNTPSPAGSPAAGPSDDSTRPIPSNPSIAFQRKQAKALLRALKAEDPAALRRARTHHAAFRQTPPTAPTLADAQLIVAREYGFSSWPRLVQYFVPLEREHGTMTFQRHEALRADESVGSLLARHSRQEPAAARTLAAYVPRLYGMTTEEVLAASITIDDARAAVARECRCSSWADLMARVAAVTQTDRDDPWANTWANIATFETPYARAWRAMRTHDLATLGDIVAEHPEFLRPIKHLGRDHNLVAGAVQRELEARTPEALAVTDWLVAQGADLQTALDRALLQRRPTADVMRHLLDRGADPHWVAPNGLAVLEHLIVRAWGSGEATDIVARRVKPRRALWVAAGLGDVEAVREYFDRAGKLIPSAFRDRVPTGLGVLRLPPVAEPTHVELLSEVALIAALNGRAEVMRVLVERGFPIDYMGWGDQTLLMLAVGNQWMAAVEMLVALGADLDKRGRHPDFTARDGARYVFEHNLKSTTARRILELCDGGDPDEIIAAIQARPTPELRVADNLQAVLDLAGDDAARSGQTEIHVDNLFLGILRAKYSLPVTYLRNASVRLATLHAMFADRLLPSDDRITRPKLMLGADARAAVERMVANGKARKLESVTSMHLLMELINDDATETSRLLESVGGNLAVLRRDIVRAFHLD